MRLAFQEFLQDPKSINRERIPYDKWRQMHIFLDRPDLKPTNPADSNLKHRAQLNYHLINRKMYRNPIGHDKT